MSGTAVSRPAGGPGRVPAQPDRPGRGPWNGPAKSLHYRRRAGYNTNLSRSLRSHPSHPGPPTPLRRLRMAANTSFKVQCPSCEAMVPIRDSNLVGKKIDCPKCKYRFVVEEPDGDMGDDRPTRPPARRADRPKAKKKGGNNVLILGSVIGGVALIVLGVVAYMLLSGDSGSSTPPKPNAAPVAANTSPPPAVNPAPAVTATPAATPAAGNDAPAQPAVPPGVAELTPGRQEPVAEISNLL